MRVLQRVPGAASGPVAWLIRATHHTHLKPAVASPLLRSGYPAPLLAYAAGATLVFGRAFGGEPGETNDDGEQAELVSYTRIAKS